MDTISRMTGQAMSARLVVMMTASDKAALVARAGSSGLTTSEYVRRAALAYDGAATSNGEAMLAPMIETFVELVADMRQTLERTNARTADHFAEIDAIRAARPTTAIIGDAALLSTQVFGTAA